MNANGGENEYQSSTSTLDVVESPRKRMRVDTAGRKSWSLMDRKTDTEVLQEMGVSILEQDETETNCDVTPSTSIHKPNMKRKHDIENVNPNINSGSPRSRFSPKSPRNKVCSPSPGPSTGRSPRSSEKAKPLQEQLETTLSSEYLIDEETPLAQSVSAEYLLAHTGFGAGVTTHNSYTPRKQESSVQDNPQSTEDTFSMLSDEMMLSVFRWLPKRTLAHCMLVCKRWYRVACDETLWQRLDLGNKSLSKDALGRILARKPIIIRLASSELGEWNPPTVPPSRVQYLDLSMCSASDGTLSHLLSAAPQVRKLSLESVAVTDTLCEIIGQCRNLETLNLTMAQGITSNGLTAILDGCTCLQSLNISWCGLKEASLKVLVSRVPRKLQRLNLAGARKLTDDMVSALVQRAPRLQELDLSDCPLLGAAALLALLPTGVEHLALSRCYLLPPHALTKLSGMPSLQYLEVWGMLQSASLNALRATLPAIQINQFMFSAIARPTVGPRRTSIWGLRTRD